MKVFPLTRFVEVLSLHPFSRWLILNRTCVPNIVAGQDGCVKSPQIKAIQYLGAFAEDDFFSVATVSADNIVYDVSRPVKVITIRGYIWLFNGVLLKSVEGAYCAEKKAHVFLLNKLNVMTRYSIRGRLSIQYECPATYDVPIEPQLEYGIVNRDTCKEIISHKNTPK